MNNADRLVKVVDAMIARSTNETDVELTAIETAMRELDAVVVDEAEALQREGVSASRRYYRDRLHLEGR